MNRWIQGPSLRGNTISFGPYFVIKKFKCINFMVRSLLETPSISQGINKKNGHYHWIIYRHSVQI